VLAGGLCVVGLVGLVTAASASAADVVAVALYAVLALLASSQRLRMHPTVGTMSLGFLFVFAAIFQCGTAAGIGVAAASAVGGLLFTGSGGRRQPVETTLQAIGTLSVAAWAAGEAFARLGGMPPAPGRLSQLLWPAGAAVAVYQLMSVIGVTAVALAGGHGLPKRWLREAGWMTPVYFAGGAAALAVGLAYRQFGMGVFVLGLPLLYALQRTYAVRADRAAEQLRHLEERNRASEKLARLYLSIVEALSTAVEAKDQGTRLHVRRVQTLAQAVAQRVGLQGEELQAVETAAVLHDIGKLAVPDHILSKPARLTESEFQLVRTHPEVGEAILRPIDFGVDVGAIVRHHHEKMDGSGYPDGLVGEAIPMGARILGVIDVYDALVSERPYRQAWRAERAVEYLRQHAGSAFDPAVVEALIEVLAETAPEPRVPVGLDAPPCAAARATVSPPVSPVEARVEALEALVEEFAARDPVRTCVAYEVDGRNAEIAVLAARGEHASAFGRLRTPIGLGPSATAARDGRVIIEAAAGADMAGLCVGPPEDLAVSTVAAVPALDSSGQTRAVVSLYGDMGTPMPDALLAEVAVRSAEIIRSRSAEPDPGCHDGERAELLEYASFVAGLSRAVSRAQRRGERLVVMAVSMGDADRWAPSDLLLDLAQELRVCAGGEARVVEREGAGEIVAILPPAVEAALRECVQAFGRAAQGGRPAAGPLGLAVGSAVYPDDDNSAHGLVCLAEMRMARGRLSATAEQLLLPA